MYIFKNYRNYIPLLTMIIIILFLNLYFGNYMYNWLDWSEMLVIILPFVVVPIINFIYIVLNTHRLKPGKILYISILFSYVLQFLPIILLMIGNDDKGIGIMQGYCIFLIVIDSITLVYPWRVYTYRNQ